MPRKHHNAQSRGIARHIRFMSKVHERAVARGGGTGTRNQTAHVAETDLFREKVEADTETKVSVQHHRMQHGSE